MTDIHSHSPEQLIEACGGYAEAVDVIMKCERTLWEFIHSDESPASQHTTQSLHRTIDEKRLLESFPAPHSFLAQVLIKSFESHGLWVNRNGQIHFHVDIFQPFLIVKELLGRIKPDHDLHYFVMQNIRRHYGCVLSQKTAHLFHLSAGALNSTLTTENSAGDASQGSGAFKRVRHYRRQFLPYLYGILKQDFADEAELKGRLFTECCRLVGYIHPHYKNGYINIRTSFIDAEFLLSNLFGLKTSIQGFDALFGGGLMLTDAFDSSDASRMDGRTVLILGRYGTGKTLLSLQLAAEVARKGGLAWLMPLEQTANEYLYTMESMGVLPKDNSVLISTDVTSALDILQRSRNGCGALIILTTIRDSFADFLSNFAENAAMMQQYSPRLLCVDPFNSIYRNSTAAINELRAQMMETIMGIKQSGTNILLVSEVADSLNEHHFEQNIADTVINLSIEKRFDHIQSYLEIKKSRFQREFRGTHPFSIVTGKGITIYPSVFAVRAMNSVRHLRRSQVAVRFGLPAIDHILGESAITAGDVIAFSGQGEAYQIPLGILFLLNSDTQIPSKRHDRPYKLPLRNSSLLITGLDDESAFKYVLKQEFLAKHCALSSTRKGLNDIRICSIPGSNVQPSYLLQRIDEEFLSARLNGQWIDRVMVDNITYWEMLSPTIREEPSFGYTLIAILRRHGVTSLFICGDDLQAANSSLQRSIIGNADCVIKFDQFEHRGIPRAMMQVGKTRAMRHRREWFEVNYNSEELSVNPNSSLLRIGPGGNVSPIGIRFFLHPETQIQKEYYAQTLDRMKTVLLEDAAIDFGYGTDLLRTMRLGSLSAKDELQIFQLDGTQVANCAQQKSGELALRYFPPSMWHHAELADFIPQFKYFIDNSHGSLFAAPLYTDLSLLAYRKNILDRKDTASWHDIVEACEWWEQRHPDPSDVFFDFPRVKNEDFNSLFFEILQSLAPVPENRGQCRLLHWLRDPAVFKSLKIYRRLCRRSYSASIEAASPSSTHHPSFKSEVSPRAVIWRHTYAALNQLMLILTPSERAYIQICTLPGEVTVVNECYLSIPSYSAAPDVGIEIIKLLTSPEAEAERWQLGVGLPTRWQFYSHVNDSSKQLAISPYFSMEAANLSKLIAKAFTVSSFGCYSYYSDILTNHLQKTIEIPDSTERELDEQISMILNSLKNKMEAVNPIRDCTKCRA